jgi:16S rRNA (adenine1518-N6/adenine1519-N6)-dimethyltransferase
VTGRDPFAHYRAAMDAIGFKPSRTLGQNFLLDPSLHRAIADAAAPGPDDLVLEVGTGLGFLTRELAARAGRVVSVEIDSRLLQIAASELAHCGNVQLVAADALGGPGRSLPEPVLSALGATRTGAFLVVANLPYSAAGPLLAELCVLERPPDRAVVLVQKELAERIAGGPQASDYGGLTAVVQSLYRVRRLRDVPPDVFRPRPRVGSSVLHLELDPTAVAAGSTSTERRSFRSFIQALFRARRKSLRSTLPPAVAAVGGGLPPMNETELKRRAEDLEPSALWDLWRTALSRP